MAVLSNSAVMSGIVFPWLIASDVSASSRCGQGRPPVEIRADAEAGRAAYYPIISRGNQVHPRLSCQPTQSAIVSVTSPSSRIESLPAGPSRAKLVQPREVAVLGWLGRSSSPGPSSKPALSRGSSPPPARPWLGHLPPAEQCPM